MEFKRIVEMSETIVIGNKYKLFLTNNFKYEGRILARDSSFIRILDYVSGKEIIIPIINIATAEEVL